MSDDAFPVAENSRYFIVNLGRCGSSLLGAILADAGADFGVRPPGDWDPRTGQMESDAIRRAAHHYRRAWDIGEGRKYVLSPAFERKIRLGRARRALRAALAQGRFVKIGDLDLVVQPAFRLGFEPVVIVNFRQLEPMLPSVLVGRTNTGPDELAREYVRVYRQGLMLLQTFGGCTVEYNELLDPGSERWAHALGSVTGCDPAALLGARSSRLRGQPDPDEILPAYEEAHELCRALRGYSGRVVPRSRQCERAVRGRMK